MIFVVDEYKSECSTDILSCPHLVRGEGARPAPTNGGGLSGRTGSSFQFGRMAGLTSSSEFGWTRFSLGVRFANVHRGCERPLVELCSTWENDKVILHGWPNYVRLRRTSFSMKDGCWLLIGCWLTTIKYDRITGASAERSSARSSAGRGPAWREHPWLGWTQFSFQFFAQEKVFSTKCQAPKKVPGT